MKRIYLFNFNEIIVSFNKTYLCNSSSSRTSINFYINDLPGVVSYGNKIVLYADDSKLYKPGYSLCS